MLSSSAESKRSSDMKVLEICEYYLHLCGLFSNGTNAYFKSVNTYFFTSAQIVLILMSGTNVYQNLTNLNESLKSFIPLLAGIYIFFGYIGVGMNTNSLETLHKQLQSIVDTGKFNSEKIICKNIVY